MCLAFHFVDLSRDGGRKSCRQSMAVERPKMAMNKFSIFTGKRHVLNFFFNSLFKHILKIGWLSFLFYLFFLCRFLEMENFLGLFRKLLENEN